MSLGARLQKRAGLLWQAALVLLVLVLFREALAGGVFYKRDIHRIWHPEIEGFVRAVAGGALPLWDASPAFGQPLLADPQAQVLYPLHWLSLLLRPWTYCTVYALAHTLFSALCMLALARRFGLSRLASFAAASAWTLSGPFLSLVDLWHHFAGASVIPAVFLAAESAARTPRPRNLVALGLVLGLQMLAGSADMCAMTLLALLVYLGITSVDWRSGRSVARLVGRGAAALVIAVAVGAGTWVAALDAVSRSSRQALPDEVRTYWSMHPLSLVETLVPGVPGALPLSPRLRQAVSEGREPFLQSLYLGLPFLALVAAALLYPGDRRRRLAFAALGVGALLVALGRHAPFYGLAVTLLPPLRLLRFPVKAMAIVAFAWALLAGYGAEAWARRASSPVRGAPGRRVWTTVVFLPVMLVTVSAAAAALLALARPSAVQAWAAPALVAPGLEAAAALAKGTLLHLAIGAAVALLALVRPGGERRVGMIAAAVVLFAVADLGLAHPRPNPVAPAALYQHRPELLARIGDLGAARVYVYDYSDRARPKEVPDADALQKLARQPAGWAPGPSLALAQQLALAPQAAGRFGLRQAFDVDYRGLQLEPLAYLTRLVRLREREPDELLRLLHLGAVTHVVAQHRLGGERLSVAAELPGLFAAPLLLLRVSEPWPRARVVEGASIGDGLQAVSMLLDPAFDPARTVLLSEGAPVRAAAGFVGRVRIVEERADRVRLEADLNRDGYVVLADTWDPGWRVRVDGRPVPLLRANLAFRAAALPAGRHLVEMVYRPPLLLAGVACSLLTLLACVSFLLARR